MAPQAVQGAALQKNRGPDAWTVIDTEFLNVKNRAGQRNHFLAISSFCFHYKQASSNFQLNMAPLYRKSMEVLPSVDFAPFYLGKKSIQRY